MEQMKADPITFEPQRFQPMIKANNRFIAEDGRNYGRPTENASILFEQQNFQPAINAINHFIEENSRSYKRGRLQQYDQGAVTCLRVPDDKAINRNITENYLTERTQQEPNLPKGPQGESAFNHTATNINEAQNMVERYRQQAQRNPDVWGQDRIGKNSINRELTERGQVQQDAVNLNSNFRIRQETLEGNATNSTAHQETRQGENRQTPIQGGYQDASVRKETINANNRPYLQNIHREYSNNERNTSSDRQFFVPQEEQSRGGRKNKAVQVDHVEEQYVIRQNTFSGKNQLCIEDTERPVFVNNYYAGDNPQQMFREVRENFNGKSNNSNFRLQQFQTQALKHDKASQSMDDWDVRIARMHRMEETHPIVENYHNNQDPPVIVQPNKMQELTLSSTRSYQMPDYSVPLPNTHAYKSPPDDSLLPGQHNQAVMVTPNIQGDLNNSLLETIKRVTSAVEQQVILSRARVEHSIIQNNNLFQELIKAQNKRDLDLALM